MRKGQGLPLSTIVIAALALLVLILIAAAFIPAVGDALRAMLGIAREAPADETKRAAFAEKCRVSCAGMEGASHWNDIRSRDICLSNILVYELEVCSERDNCFQDDDAGAGNLCTGRTEFISMGCSFTLANGTTCTMDAAQLEACCEDGASCCP
jgi:hypothetical protein